MAFQEDEALSEVAPTLIVNPLDEFSPSAEKSLLLERVYCRLLSSDPLKVKISFRESKVNVVKTGFFVSSAKVPLLELLVLFDAS